MKLTTTKIIFLFIALYASISNAREVAGIEIPESIKPADTMLVLNGSGIRTKFFFNIYVGSLYLPNKNSNPNGIINQGGPFRVSMHILYDEISAEKFNAGWSAGFDENLTPDEKTELKSSIDSFYSMFKTAHEGDVIDIDVSNSGVTRISFNGDIQGSINNRQFPEALLKIWLGDNPADEELKDGMLGS